MNSPSQSAELRGRITEFVQRIRSKLEKTTTVTHLYRHDYMAIRGILSLEDPHGSIGKELLAVDFTKINNLTAITNEILEWKRVQEQCLMLMEYCNKRLRAAHTVCAYVKGDVTDVLLLPLSLLINRAINQMAAIVGL